MIEVTGLVKKYGNHVAVDHLSFRLEPGKIYGFLGPNGAGKSTTMNMMTGYIGPTEGTILINGHDIVKEPAEAKRSPVTEVFYQTLPQPLFPLEFFSV